MGVGSPTERCITYQSLPTKEMWLSLPQQPATASDSSPRESDRTPSLPQGGIFNCVSHLQSYAVSSCEQQSCLSQRPAFSQHSFQPSAYIVPTLSAVAFLILKWNVWYRCLIFGWAFTVAYAQHWTVKLSTLTTTLYNKKVLCWKLQNPMSIAINISDKTLGKIIPISSLLEPVMSLNMDLNILTVWEINNFLWNNPHIQPREQLVTPINGLAKIMPVVRPHLWNVYCSM